MNLLLVDDEFLIVQGLKNQIEGNVPGIDRILTAYSAQQARKIYQSSPVDILVTDVAMPRESGLDLVRWVNEEGYQSVNILLTGHEDFTYAKEALHLRCFRYILKPVNMEELKQTLSEAQDEVRRSSRPGRMRAFWRSLLSGETPPDEESIARRLRENSLPGFLLEKKYLYCLLTIHSKKDTYVDFSQRIPMPSLDREISSRIKGIPFLVMMKQGKYMVISDAQTLGWNNASEASSALTDLAHSLEDLWPDFRFVFYLFASLPLSAACYAYELLEQYSSSVLAAESTVIPVLDLTGESTLSPTDPGSAAEDLPLRKWSEWLAAGRTDDILRELHFYLYKAHTVYSVKNLTFVYYSILNMIFSLLSDRGISPKNALTQMTAHADMAEASSSPENFMHWAERILQNAQSILARNSSTGSLTETVKKYIHDNLDNPDLDRNSIADAVHVTPDYLSFLFHRESGEVLSSYLTNERIEASKKLLRTTDDSLADISAAVGFSNSSYFHRQFKKVTGQTPNAYRSEFRRK